MHNNNGSNEKGIGLNPKIWARMFPYIKDVKKYLIIVMVFMVVSAVTESSYPLFTRYAVDNFVVTGVTDGIGVFAALFAAVILVEGISVVFFSRYSMVIEMSLGPALKRALFVHLQKLQISFYNGSSVGYLLARVMSDTDRISGMVSWGLAHMSWCVIYILGMIGFMLSLNVKLALLLLLIIPVVAVLMLFFQRKVIFLVRKIREINSNITGAYNEGITGAKTAKTLVIEEFSTNEFRAVTAQMYGQQMKLSVTRALLTQIVTFCGSVAVGLVLFRGGRLVQAKLFDWGVLSAFISYAVGLVEPISQFVAMLTDVVSAQACVERVTNLLDEPCTIADTEAVTKIYGDAFFPKKENWEPIHGDIEFQNVFFKYPDGEDYVLKDFSLKIPAGTNVAIVGETGAGKSTIVNLICRFFEPTSGKILIDGRDYRERSGLWLHSSLGYVLQDPHLFSGTIAENIRYGRTEASDVDIARAAAIVSADLVAERMPNGYNTEVGEGGDLLSTGEKQLISFARAIIADPPIFVLDEATSSIDAETEMLIQSAISKVLTGRTSFIIAHRLSTISHADIILVVDDGKIIERGAHDELMRLGGRYMELYNSMRFEEEAL